jgi:hypothetical protein
VEQLPERWDTGEKVGRQAMEAANWQTIQDYVDEDDTSYLGSRYLYRGMIDPTPAILRLQETIQKYILPYHFPDR